MGLGPASQRKGSREPAGQNEAVTIASRRKKAQTPASWRMRRWRRSTRSGAISSPRCHRHVTRNYGETAKDKSDELLQHMLIATISVIILIALALGRARPSSWPLQFP